MFQTERLSMRGGGIDRRILPRLQTLEAELLPVIRERTGYVRGEEQRHNLADHMFRGSVSVAAEGKTQGGT